MPDRIPQDDDPQAPPKLVAALKDSQKRRLLVPLAIDEAVLGRASEHLKHHAKRRPHWKSLAPWAAIAASLTFGALCVHTLSKRGIKSASFVGEDFNRDGRVDILDAFGLARQIESGATIEARWDINGDGQVSRADVQAIAVRAVSVLLARNREAR